MTKTNEFNYSAGQTVVLTNGHAAIIHNIKGRWVNVTDLTTNETKNVARADISHLYVLPTYGVESMKRAETVHKALIGSGANPERITKDGPGDSPKIKFECNGISYIVSVEDKCIQYTPTDEINYVEVKNVNAMMKAIKGSSFTQNSQKLKYKVGDHVAFNHGQMQLVGTINAINEDKISMMVYSGHHQREFSIKADSIIEKTNLNQFYTIKNRDHCPHCGSTEVYAGRNVDGVVVDEATFFGCHVCDWEVNLSSATKSVVKSVYKKTKNEDEVAVLLNGLELEDVYITVAKEFMKATDYYPSEGKILNEVVKEFKHKYGKLNPGMQRMNLGNRLRGLRAALVRMAEEKRS